MSDTKDFVDFVKDSTEQPPLLKGLLEILGEAKPSAEKVRDYFKSKGYTVSIEDCEKLIAARNNVDDVLSGNLKY